MLSNNPARIPQLVKPMKKLKLQITFVFLLGMFASACSSRGGSRSDLNTSKAAVELSTTYSSWPSLSSEETRDVESTVASILSSMTTAEKVGQMVQTEISNVTPNQARDWNLSSVLNGGGSWPKGQYFTVADWVALANTFMRLALIPLMAVLAFHSYGAPMRYMATKMRLERIFSLITLALAQQTNRNSFVKLAK